MDQRERTETAEAPGAQEAPEILAPLGTMELEESLDSAVNPAPWDRPEPME